MKDIAVVEEYLVQMRNNSFSPNSGVAGFIYKGRFVLTDGNHRMNAAIRYALETGDEKYILQLLENGTFRPMTNPSQYNVTIYNLPVK